MEGGLSIDVESRAAIAGLDEAPFDAWAKAIAGIRCDTTGRSTARGGFEASRCVSSDKHGLRRPVCDAKINIHLGNGEPIFLGLQHKDLHETHAPATVD